MNLRAADQLLEFSLVLRGVSNPYYSGILVLISYRKPGFNVKLLSRFPSVSRTQQTLTLVQHTGIVWRNWISCPLMPRGGTVVLHTQSARDDGNDLVRDSERLVELLRGRNHVFEHLPRPALM